MDGDAFFHITLGDILGSGIAAGIVGALLMRYTKTVEATISDQFSKGLKVFESTRSWQERALFELLGPIFMQLERTGRAFRRWKPGELNLESKVIRQGNLTIRDLLLSKGHLIPHDLLQDATKLIEHYDAWLLKFDEVRGDGSEQTGAKFVFTGPDGYPFPREAERKFKDEFLKLQQLLYGPVNRD